MSDHSYPARALAVACAAALALLAVRTAQAARTAHTLKLATWNLEWLMTPQVFGALKDHCNTEREPRHRMQRSIPCDVAAGQERGAADFATLARYARQLDADVIAIQEVDGPDAARQVFPGYEFCFTGARAVQNTGFAIRAGLPHRCGADLEELALGGSVRRGATLILYPGTRQELRLLGVHLKSGCAHAPLAGRQHACEQLDRQGPALHAWLAAEAAAGHAYAVLGDFNRDLLADARASAAPDATRGLWSQLHDPASGIELANAAQQQPFRNCIAGQTHTGYIDYILLGGTLKSRQVPGSFERLAYEAQDAWRHKISDHCPVAIKLQVD